MATVVAPGLVEEAWLVEVTAAFVLMDLEADGNDELFCADDAAAAC